MWARKNFNCSKIMNSNSNKFYFLSKLKITTKYCSNDDRELIVQVRLKGDRRNLKVGVDLDDEYSTDVAIRQVRLSYPN